MKLEVLKDEAAEQPWYAEGLKFTCTQCGNCCTGGPGFVWISREEIRRLAVASRRRSASNDRVNPNAKNANAMTNAIASSRSENPKIT